MKTGCRGGEDDDDGGRFQVMWECMEVACVQQGLAMRIVLLFVFGCVTGREGRRGKALHNGSFNESRLLCVCVLAPLIALSVFLPVFTPASESYQTTP